MDTLVLVIFFSLIGGLFSLVGGFLLLASKSSTEKLIKYVTPFAAGALLAAAFMDVLTEAAHGDQIDSALRWALIGILVFFLFERFVHWFHHHHTDDGEHHDARTPLIIFGDTLHNFIDGIAISAAFLVDVPTGIITTLAVAAHEIPQEIGDFGLLLSKGMSRGKVIFYNILSSLATTVAAVTFYLLGQSFSIPMGIILGLVAGFFIYIAVSDIIPSIHKGEGKRFAGLQTLMLIIGVIVVSLATTHLHGFIEDGEHEHTTSEHSHDEH